jgi:cysteine desulfurase
VGVYLDWNATTPPHDDVLEAMRAAAGAAWANPSSVHTPGRRARAALEDARESVARLLGVDARDVTLTSGGTEANNLALWQPFRAALERRERPRGALVVSRIEHPSVVRTAEALARAGVEVRWIEPRASGAVDVADVASALEAPGEVALVSLQAVNHETGVVQPVERVAALAHARGALVHTDAVQAAGRLEPAAWAGADLVTVAAHKMRGPKGLGALGVRAGMRVAPLLRGGAQERGARPGTLDPVGARGFAVAAERARATPSRWAALAPLRDRLETALTRMGADRATEIVRNGSAARAPHVANLSFAGWNGAELCAALDLEGIAVSSGAACSAGTAEPSPVITAMAGPARAASAVRISLGEDTTQGDLDRAIEAVERVLARRVLNT